MRRGQPLYEEGEWRLGLWVGCGGLSFWGCRGYPLQKYNASSGNQSCRSFLWREPPASASGPAPGELAASTRAKVFPRHAEQACPGRPCGAVFPFQPIGVPLPVMTVLCLLSWKVNPAFRRLKRSGQRRTSSRLRCLPCPEPPDAQRFVSLSPFPPDFSRRSSLTHTGMS